MLSDVQIRLRPLFRQNIVESELDEELRFHFEQQVEKFIQSGSTREDALRRARLMFGGLDQVKEACREARGVQFVETLIQDFRYSLRMMSRNKIFAAVATLSLALGIAVNATFFNAINGLLFRPPSNIETPETLVSIYQTATGSGTSGYVLVWSYPDYLYYRDHNEALSGLSAYAPTPLNLEVGGEHEKGFGDLVSYNYFTVLGTKAFLGRMFVPEENDIQGSSPTTVVSYEFWHERMRADPSAIGKTIKINNLPFTVIGVAPKGMRDLGIQMAPTVWVPLALQPVLGWPPGESEALKNRGTGWLTVVGRLKEGITRDQAQSNLSLISRQLEKDYPAIENGRGVAITSALTLPPAIRGAAIGFVVLLEALGALFLLIPCANVGSLMLARAWARQAEIALRYSLGASRQRIVRQLLTESLLLALCGGVAGLLLAFLGTAALMYLKPPISLPFTFDLWPDMRVVGFTVLLTLITALLFGMTPALHISADALPTQLGGRSDAGSSGNPRRSKTRRALVVAQVSISLLLLVGSGLCVQSLRNASHIEPGFETRNILSFSVSPILDGYSATQAATYYRNLLERLNAIHGVKSTALATLLPLSYGQLQESVEMGQASGTSTQEIPVNANLVSSEYFRTIGISVVLGRSFAQDEVDTTSVIVNQTLADRFFRGRDPIGQQLRLGGGERQRVMTIIGVARDSKYRTLGEPSQPFIYEPLPAGFEGPSGTTVLVKTTGDSQPVLSAIRTQASALDKNVPISPIETMTDHLKSDLWLARTTAIILVSLGGVGLFVAMIGLYGIVSYSVTRRTHEIGIRMALGAQRIDVLKMVAREGLLLILTGTGIGLAAALALTRFLGSLLYGLRATDPLTFVGVLILFLTIALLACYIPARRATRVDPIVALRCE